MQRQRRVLAGLVPAVVLLAVASPASADHGGTSCRGQDVAISKNTLEDAERTSLCLVNLYRRAHDLPALVLDKALATASRLHSEDMVDRDYFAHTAPDGSRPPDRAAAQGYTTGETNEIISVAGTNVTPHDVVSAWQSNPDNAAVLLGPFEATGIGLALGAPEVTIDQMKYGPDGLTATQLLGTEADGATYTGLELAGKPARSAPGCKQAKADRADAHRAWVKAKKARKRTQERVREADNPVARERLADELQRKRRKVASKRLALRRATDLQKELC